jgi:osmotically-inducible protein OsmY
MTIRESAVDATDGSVTLDGCVGSWPVKQAIVEAVEHVRGVRHVVDHLKVEPAALPPRDRPRPTSSASNE